MWGAPRDNVEGALEWGSSKSKGSEEEAARKFEEEKDGHRGGKQVWPQCGKWEGWREGFRSWPYRA